jgi:NAD+ diphosphatase
MVGYFARAASTAICVDADELEHAAWMSRDEVRAAVADGRVGLPGGSSIASRMIGAWLDEEPDLI